MCLISEALIHSRNWPIHKVEDYNELNIGVFEEETDGIFSPFTSEGETVAIYNLNGVKVGETKVTGSKINVDHLPKGVYVINGKKFIK